MDCELLPIPAWMMYSLPLLQGDSHGIEAAPSETIPLDRKVITPATGRKTCYQQVTPVLTQPSCHIQQALRMANCHRDRSPL